ncbi:MAG: hypothetical protein ACREBO_02510 [Novosphingobium sp.]
MTPLTQIAGSPDSYLHSFEGTQAVIVPMDRAAYRRSIFLDRRISPADEKLVRVDAGQLGAAAPAPQPAHWIFHVAHCGSTLLARALEALAPGDSGGLVLREPLALRQLALAPDPSRLRLALGMLTRRYPGAAETVIKANVPVNFMLGEIAAAGAVDCALVLYCGLEDYLAAILRSDNHRAWLRNVTCLLAAHFGDTSGLSDGELGATLWIEQMRRFAGLIAARPETRSLDAEVLFASPARALRGVSDHLRLDCGDEQIAELTTGPLFSTYSKSPAHAFDNAARLARREALGPAIGADIAQAHAWIARHAADAEAVTGAVGAAAVEA